MIKTIGVSLGLCIALTGGAAAQAVVPPEHQEVLAVITRMFDGMREADTAKVRGVFAPGARFVRVGNRTNPDTLVYDAVDGWIAAIGRSNRTWEERVSNVRIQVDGRIASAWADYTFHLNGALSHCGIDSFEFVKLKGEWKVTQLADTQRRTGC